MFWTDSELRRVAFVFAIFFLAETIVVFLLGLAFGRSY